jgi:hypothetical protein
MKLTKRISFGIINKHGFVLKTQAQEGEMLNQATWTYYPEELEEEHRVSQVKQFRLPERWYVPRPYRRVKVARGRGRRTRVVEYMQPLRRAYAYAMPGRKTPLAEIPDDVRPTRAVYVETGKNICQNIADLLTMNPTCIRDLYSRAMLTKHEGVLDYLTGAVAYMTAKAKQDTAHYARRMPKTPAIVQFLQALAS